MVIKTGYCLIKGQPQYYHNQTIGDTVLATEFIPLLPLTDVTTLVMWETANSLERTFCRLMVKETPGKHGKFFFHTNLDLYGTFRPVMDLSVTCLTESLRMKQTVSLYFNPFQHNDTF